MTANTPEFEIPTIDEILHVTRKLAEVGRFAGGNGHFEMCLTSHLKKLGPIEQMTVGDLLRECRVANEQFNERLRRIDALLVERGWTHG